VQCEAGSCEGKSDGTYLTTYAGGLTIAAGSFTGEVNPQETYFCDGVNCSKVDAQRPAIELTPVVPELDRVYRQGDQHHIESASGGSA